MDHRLTTRTRQHFIQRLFQKYRDGGLTRLHIVGAMATAVDCGELLHSLWLGDVAVVLFRLPLPLAAPELVAVQSLCGS